MTREAVSQWESGGTMPKSGNLQQLSRLMGMNGLVVSHEAVAPTGMPSYRVQVRGAVQAGVYTEALEWPEEDRYHVNVPLSGRYAVLSPFALEVKGPSMNRQFPEGTVLICVHMEALREPIEAGKYYIVHRIFPDGKREATVKIVRPGPDGSYWLWPESDHPDHQAPIPVTGRPGEEVSVAAKIIRAIRSYE